MKSITWHEVDAALSVKRPVFAFLSQDAASSWEPGVPEFRDFVGRNVVYDRYTTPDSLAFGIATSLASWLLESPSLSDRVSEPSQPVDIAAKAFSEELQRAICLMEDLATPQHALDEQQIRLMSLADSLNALRMGFQASRFLFDNATCSDVDQLWQKMKSAGYALLDQERNPQAELLTRARDLLSGEIPDLRAKVEQGFRRAVRR